MFEPFWYLKSYKYPSYRFLAEAILYRRLKRGCLLLDAGCGVGHTLSQPIEDVEVVGVDILHANAVASKRLWRNNNYVAADLTRLPFIDGAFYGVLSVNVIEHVDDKNAAIGELSRITQKGGFFVGCSTNLLNPAAWLDVNLSILMKPFIMKYMPGQYDRHSRFSPASLVSTFTIARYQMDCYALLGDALFTNKKVPWSVCRKFLKNERMIRLAYLWIIFDKITKKKPLLFFKEILVWQATRT